MIRTQISLDERQMTRLRAVAARRGISIAAVVREAVDAALEADPDDAERRREAALGAVGAHVGSDEDRGRPVAAGHDAYLVGVYRAGRSTGETSPR